MNILLNSCKIVWISFMLFLTTCPALGQVKKTKQLTPNDYKLWSTLRAKEISDHGKWVSYSLSYESKKDTLFVKNTSTKQTFAYPKGYKGKFMHDTWFACMLPNNRFQLQNLMTGNIREVNQVQSFAFENKGQYILLFCNDKAGKTKIIIQNLEGNIIETIVNVTSFSLSPKNDKLAYCTSNSNEASVGVLQFGKKVLNTNIVKSSLKLFENVIWHREGTSIVFAGKKITAKELYVDTVLYYKIKSKQLFEYDTSKEASWPKEMVLLANYSSSLGISDDEQRIFFIIKKPHVTANIKNKPAVEVWNSADKDIFSIRNTYGTPDTYSQHAVWWPETSKFRVVADGFQSILNGNQQFALSYNTSDNKPTTKENADRNYYLVNIATGEKTRFLQQHPGGYGYLNMSPNGKFIAYFKGVDWWVYSILDQKHTNITKNIDIQFYNTNGNSGGFALYGIAGWSTDDQSLLLYDQFDIWEFSPNGEKNKRLTNGRNHSKIIRFVKGENDNSLVSKSRIFDLSNRLPLKVKTNDYNESGYYSLLKGQTEQTLVYGQKWISEYKKATDANVFMFLQEDFNSPPSLYVKKGTNPPIAIFNSNPQSESYGWGASRLIEYKNSKGVNLKGVLFYPFNYNPEKNYPMIVSVYEKQTKALHSYVNPSLLSRIGFNISNFTSQGYFVLLPDIIYEIGNPGFSAVDCVIAATTKAIKTATINKNKLGLFGHSFGGFETNFIISQTNMFAAAVSGAGYSDFTSNYLSVSANYKIPEMFRFEHFQLRMGKSLFEDLEGYRRNSPINTVSNVSTPLLSYTGKEDTQVNPYQSMEFYLALRRLEKEHIMLVYPKEDHVIQIPENQIDLTNRIFDWYGFYLKDEKKPTWFQPQ